MTEFQIINPYNNKVLAIKNFESLSSAQNKSDILQENFKTWRNDSFDLRAAALREFQSFLVRSKDDLARLITTDMGKPIAESIGEVEKSILCCDFYIEHADAIARSMKLESGYREPIGVVLGIMPWNYPLWQIIRYLIPALISGNVCLIKPAFNTYRVAEFINQFFQNHKYKVTDVTIPINEDVEQLISYKNIAGISLTGSVGAGQQVGSLAGKYLKPCILELGGSDPYIIFADCDIDEAIAVGVKSRFMNNGQTCIAAKRFYFQESIFKEAIELFAQKAKSFCSYGDPLDQATTIGPMARLDLKQGLEDQLDRSGIEKSQIIYQAEIDSMEGNYFPTTIIDGSNLSDDNPLLLEEVFGPMAVCYPFKEAEDAIVKANQTEFGLGASIWTLDDKIKKQCIANIDSGLIAINSMVISDPAKPFGGRKNSGIGIELGVEGALSFTKYKTIIES